MRKGHEFEEEWIRIYGNVFRNEREKENVVIILKSRNEKQAKKNTKPKTFFIPLLFSHFIYWPLTKHFPYL